MPGRLFGDTVNDLQPKRGCLFGNGPRPSPSFSIYPITRSTRPSFGNPGARLPQSSLLGGTRPPSSGPFGDSILSAPSLFDGQARPRGLFGGGSGLTLQAAPSLFGGHHCSTGGLFVGSRPAPDLFGRCSTGDLIAGFLNFRAFSVARQAPLLHRCRRVRTRL